MTTDEWDDEEVWTDDDAGADEEDTMQCPECNHEFVAMADKCPACGYWITEADLRVTRSGMAKPAWLRVTAAIVLAAFLFSLLSVGLAMFWDVLTTD
jgi:hypothetical protein